MFPKRHGNNQAGFSLIELIIFIVVVGITGVSALLALQTVLKNSPDAYRQTVAIGLAQERMELILGQKAMRGFGSFTDPCTWGSPPNICTPFPGYAIASNIVNTAISGDNNYKIVTVTVSGLGNAKLNALVAKTS